MSPRLPVAAACAALLVTACGLESDASSRRDPVEERHILLTDGDRSRLEEAVEAAGGHLESFHPGTGLATVLGLGGDGAASVSGRPGVVAAGRDERVRLLPRDLLGEPRVVVPQGAAGLGDPAMAPHLGRQWHLTAIGADRAWAAGYVGSSAVTVAVLDTGIDYLHPDLVGRVDLDGSISFVPGDDALLEATHPGRHPITDLHYHGTHVAATIASNAIAAAGVTSEVTLIGVKVLGQNGEGSLSGIVRGILHAVDAGADVINMSLGGAYRRRGLDWYLGVVHVVLSYAIDRGVTVVVAAGNEGRDLDADPALFDLFCEAPQVICVSATGPTASAGDLGPWEDVDAIAPYSNRGSSVDLAGPGGAAEPVWAACAASSLHLDCHKAGTVVGLVGTSMATPHASGVAALLVDIHGRRPGRVRAILEGLAVDRGDAGWDPLYGHGRLDVVRSLGLNVPEAVDLPAP